MKTARDLDRHSFEVPFIRCQTTLGTSLKPQMLPKAGQGGLADDALKLL